MTEHRGPDPVAHDRSEGELDPEPAVMPRWVPTLIGIVLVGLAALAVWTGMQRYGGDTLVGMVRGGGDNTERRRPNVAAPAPSGEPDAGASLVVGGNTVPAANAPESGEARAVISGGPEGVTATMRITARRGVVFNVIPEDAMVYVNDLPIGEVTQFNSTDEIYDFAAPGSYTVRVEAEGYAPRQYLVNVGDEARQDVARISAKLEKL